MSVLIPVRCPLNEANRNAIKKGLELISDDPDPELVIVHVNRRHEDERVRRNDLRTTVESEFGQLPAHYVVRDGFLYEEAILNEAVRHDVSHIVLSERRRNAWQQLLRETLHIEADLESFLIEHLDAKIHIVSDER